jgi:hypothetical protein
MRVLARRPATVVSMGMANTMVRLAGALLALEGT